MHSAKRLVIAALILLPAAAAAQAPRTLPAPDATFEEPFSNVNPGTLRELRDGRVAIARAQPYRVDWVLPNGTKQSAAPLRHTPVPMGEAEKKEEEAFRIRRRWVLARTPRRRSRAPTGLT